MDAHSTVKLAAAPRVNGDHPPAVGGRVLEITYIKIKKVRKNCILKQVHGGSHCQCKVEDDAHVRR